MKIINLGSCRQDSLINHFDTIDINKEISYPHYTKEILEVINYLKFGNLTDEETLFIFRSPLLNKLPICNRQQLQDKFESGDVYVIEITSKKTYEYNNKYLHHIAVDMAQNDEVRNNIINRIQTKEEIENDIIEIKNILKKPLVIVSHIITFQEGRRFELAEWLKEICFKYNITFINPVEELKKRNINLNNTFEIEDKIAHYTNYGHLEIGKIYYEIISKIYI